MENNSGYIALVSVIIISLILSVIVFTLNFKGFFTRFNILDSELKEISLRYALSCREIAIYKLKANNAYMPDLEGDTILISLPDQEETCIIQAVELKDDKILVKTKGIRDKAQTNLETVIKKIGDNFTILSSKEVQIFN